MRIRWGFFLTLFFIIHSSAEAIDRIRVAVSNPNMPNLTLAVAQKRGFLKDEGVEAEVIRMNPNVSITALASGDIDYSQLFGAVVGAAVVGLPVRVVAGFMINWPLTLIAQPEFRSINELRGRTLGVSSYGATPEVASRLIFKHFGIDPDKEIKVVALGSDAARLTALKQKVVDVIVISPPADAQMEKLGFRILARAHEFFNLPYLGLGVNTRKIRERPDEVKRVIRAGIKANRYIYENREGAVQVLMEWGRVERDFAFQSYDGLRNLFNLDGSIPEDGLRLVIEQARKSAKINREISPSEVADLALLREVQSEIGTRRR